MAQMTTAQASEIVQSYTGQPLLESLERIQQRMDESDDLIMSKDVRIAYHILMAGFMQLML